MTKSLDLGCGSFPKNPFNADQLFGVDVRDDLEANVKSADLVIDPIPYEDESFEYLTAGLRQLSCPACRRSASADFCGGPRRAPRSCRGPVSVGDAHVDRRSSRRSHRPPLGRCHRPWCSNSTRMPIWSSPPPDRASPPGFRPHAARVGSGPRS
jgi:hypothetical protein